MSKLFSLLLIVFCSIEVYSQTYEDSLWMRASSGRAQEKYDYGIYLLETVKDTARSIPWLEKSAQLRNSGALYQVGYMFCFGEYYGQSYVSSFWFFNESAKKGHPDAQYFLAQLYELGLGCEINADSSYYWYEQSANQNCYGAQLKLGRLLLEKGDTLSDKEAFYWVSSASVISGDSIGDVTFLLGQLYLGGRGVLPDTLKAIELFYKANSEGDKLSYYLIGDSFMEGWVSQCDTVEAFNWYMKGALNEEAHSVCQVAAMYYYGTGIEKDYSKSLMWSEKGFELGGKGCEALVGNHYYYGRGVEIDYDKAFPYVESAASKGFRHSKVMLFSMYFKGLGVKKDRKLANQLAKELGCNNYRVLNRQLNKIE